MSAVAKARWSSASPRFLVLVALAAALGWAAMLVHHQVGHGLSGPHFAAQYCGPLGLGIGGATLWLTGWGVMVLAMMLPPALPLFRAVVRLGSSRIDGPMLITASALGFVAVWLLAGAALWLAGTTIASGMRQIPGAASWSVSISGGAAILAGLYQFTPLKKACLTACRSPVGIVMIHWTGNAPVRTAVRIGLHFGAICVGCCWALMLLTLAVGTMAMPLMVAVSFFMLAERLLPSVRFLVPAQAAFACLVGLLILTRQLPPGFLFI
jgi:predicted metal-binding membrane protein